ncbi:hypothetical protein [Mucilaginibacter gotjawali]|uniref:Uncharacterized protein n=2 Tax=Mucilaginibacter gotjawali TaxID=1550579 RepID=A0A839SKN6_9SPHI|nr:hypothetical protein [Mucilaginibacter gotjawali]MBB3058845.1 hypothetical protein [Mucilaginibacter gotjawali]BAU52186.1 hypothetical protein MgSA37_00336 [Mucilaginibacter gotjawali]
MKFKLLMALACCFFITCSASGQHLFYPVMVIKKAPEGAFSFTKKWSYPEGVIKYENGKFEKTDGEKLEAADTAHLYFTANCKTNIQGGYTIKYCSATRKRRNISLNFSGGMPAYANEFHLALKNNTFNFDPRVVYPELIMDEKIIYKVTGCKLIIYQKNYAVANNISGYIKARFTEIIQNSKKGTQTNKYYFEGYFKTPVN